MHAITNVGTALADTQQTQLADLCLPAAVSHRFRADGPAVMSFAAAPHYDLQAAFGVLLPLADEPWLEHTYGASYRRYKRRTPRFLSLTKLLERPLGAER